MIYIFKTKRGLLIFVCLQGNSNKKKITVFSDKVERDIVIIIMTTFTQIMRNLKANFFAAFTEITQKRLGEKRLKI